MSGYKYLAEQSAGQRAGRNRPFVRGVLVALAASFMLLPAAGAFAAQDDDAKAQAAKAEAEAKAKAAAEARAKAQAFAKLQQQIKEFRAQEAQQLKQNEAEATQDLQEQQRLAEEQVKRRDAAEARSKQLDRDWAANETHIKEIQTLLDQHKGNLGELFGVTRQVAGDAASVLSESVLSTQFNPPPGGEERSAFMRRLAGAKALPSITELERLWYELMREMVGSGKVVRYQADVLQLEDGKDTGTAVPTDVVRIGPFTVLDGREYLGYESSRGELTQLDGVLANNFRDIAGDFTSAAPGTYSRAVVDPGRGQLLGRYLKRPSWLQRVQLGEAVGYVIIAVGILGLLLAIYQYGYLLKMRFAVKSQLKDLSRPTKDNPLGRLLLAFGGSDEEGDGKPPVNAEVAELRLSEAVLREVPKLERFQAFLRLAVAAGPLLGLIGTVIGMIITFHAIVASGASDPRLMARGIGQAMIATVLGLGIAIPLLFVNAGLAAFSRGITQILDEQSDALLATTITETRKRNGG